MGIEIRDVRVICTAPECISLVVVKVLTNEPELYGLGCATFAHRYRAVETVINDYLKPFLIGKDPCRYRRYLAIGHGNELLAQRTGA